MILPSQGCAILSGMKDSAFLLQEPTDLLEVIFGVVVYSSRCLQGSVVGGKSVGGGLWRKLGWKYVRLVF